MPQAICAMNPLITEYRSLPPDSDDMPDTGPNHRKCEIIQELGLEAAQRFVASFDRPNVRYTIAELAGGSARERLWQFIAREHSDDAGIIKPQT